MCPYKQKLSEICSQQTGLNKEVSNKWSQDIQTSKSVPQTNGPRKNKRLEKYCYVMKLEKQVFDLFIFISNV